MRFRWHVLKEWSYSLVLAVMPGLFWLIAIYFGWIPFAVGLISFGATFAYFVFLTQCSNWFISSKYVARRRNQGRAIEPYSGIIFLVLPLMCWLAFWVMSLLTIRELSVKSVYYWLTVALAIILALPILRNNYQFLEFSYPEVEEETEINQREQMGKLEKVGDYES